MGAEMAGNADGSIPPWNPEGTPIPEGFVPGSDNYIDPYADEKPLYTVDASNWQEYKDNLTVGTQAMFERYGDDGFKLHVYPTKRGAVRPDWLYANNVKNATNATLVDDGQRIAALQLRARHRGVDLPSDTARYMLTRSKRDMRSLYGLLDKLDLEALRAQRRLTIPFVRSVLGL